MFSTLSRFSTGDSVLDVTLLCGLAALAVTALLVLQILLLRWRAQRRRVVWAAVVARWRPVLLATASGEAVERPALRRRERQALLLLWNQIQEGLRGAAHESLNRFAVETGLLRMARQHAAQRGGRERMLGLATLAHAARAEDATLLETLLGSPRWITGMGAARALLRIDPAQAAPKVIDAFLSRPDWPLARLGTLLREAGAASAAQALAERLKGGTSDERVRLLPLAPSILTGSPLGERVVEEIVEGSADAAELAAALPQVQGPSVLPRVRELCAHPDVAVRAQAALALGRLGQPADRDRLMALLADRQWWVRYRAAQALLALPGAALQDVVALCLQLPDRFARDIVAQVAAEHALRGRAR